MFIRPEQVSFNHLVNFFLITGYIAHQLLVCFINLSWNTKQNILLMFKRSMVYLALITYPYLVV